MVVGKVVYLLLFTVAILRLHTQQLPRAGFSGGWGDQQDGTYLNPILPADYSDLDAIRVENEYYAISSTMQFSPGMIILHSKDLVNWTIVGHAVADLTQISPELNWDRMSRGGRGVWAGALRFHDGLFWIYFATPDEGIFVTTAKSAEGPWSPLTALRREPGWDDCCPIWDDKEQEHLACTRFSQDYRIHLFDLASDGRHILPGTDFVMHQSRGSEANKLYRIDGLYYHLFSEDHGDEGRVVMMERSKALHGPWEIRQLNRVQPAVDREPNQGGLIETPSGSWWFLTHHGSGGHWEGRSMSLLPVTWMDGWPILGDPDAQGLGRMVWRSDKPVPGYPVESPQTSDDFTLPRLAPQWEWNYQPRADRWSLSERPGFLRLHAFQPLLPANLLFAGNTVSQRSMRTQKSRVTAKLDLSNMVNGQVGGICHFAAQASGFGVLQTAGVRKLMLKQGDRTLVGPVVRSRSLWLRSTWGLEGHSRYAYSLDGVHFSSFGPAWQLAWGNYRGDHVGLFTYNDQADAGWLDVDWFHYPVARSLSKISPRAAERSVSAE